MVSAKLVTKGRVLDLDLDVDQPPVADILVADGRIVAVGEDATRMGAERADVQYFDATDRLVIPGLINAHYHSHDVLLRGLFEQIPLDVWTFYSGPGNYKRLRNADVYLRTLLGATECLTNGITTLQDMVTIVDADREHVGEVLSAYAASGIRAVLGLQIADLPAAVSVPYWDKLDGKAAQRLPKGGDVGPLKALIEEMLGRRGDGDRLTWALAPSGPQRCSNDTLSWVSALAERHGLQVFTHLYEARSQAVLARMAYRNGSLVDHLARFGLLSPQLTIAHGVWIDDDELRRFGDAGANVAFNPMSNMKLLNGFAPIREYIANGANVALGCDNCSGNDAQSLLQSTKLFALYWAMQSAAGDTGAARQAFHAATMGGARALGMEGQVGAIRPGYRADLVTLNLEHACYRPLNSALRQLVYGETGTAIDMVMVEGNVVVSKGQLVEHSKRMLMQAAEMARERLLPGVRAAARRNQDILGELLQAYEKADRYPLPIDRYSMR